MLAAGIAADDDHYPRMARTMERYGYTWKAYKVTTDDGFILTTFRITGNSDGPFTPTKPPVLIQHGDYDDAVAWLRFYKDGVPMHMQLAEDGYDVWMGNNRGTVYSQARSDGLTPDDKEYWNWSWAEMGIYDDVANIKAIKKESGAEKVFYLGYSQGTVQMFYALSHLDSSFFADNLYKFVALAPCTISPEDGSEDYWLGNLYSIQDLGIHSLYGHDERWVRDYERICTELSEEACT